MKNGKVYLVGAGPSDIGLFTLKGKHLLEIADVVVYDALAGQAVLGLIPAKTRCIDVGKHAGNHPVPQDEINRILLNEALNGNIVVRLKGGDPFLFGRGGEELELLTEAEIPFEIVPGVTSAISVPAYAGIPVTHRDFCSSLHIITGHTKKNPEADINYEALVKLDGTLVFLMGLGALKVICQKLIAAGMKKDMPAAVLERGTTARQRRVVATLDTLENEASLAEIQTPAIIVVGRVCDLAYRFCWAEKRSLGGVRIVVTRPRELASQMTELLREKGAEVLELPSIETHSIEPNLNLDRAIDDISSYGWLVFTSPSGVRLFLEHLCATRRDVRTLKDVKLAAIGPATAHALEKYGLIADLVPTEYNAVELGHALAKKAVGTMVLLARAKDGTTDLTDVLESSGIAYNDVAVYETHFVNNDATLISDLLDSGDVDYVAFTSASTVSGFVKTLGEQRSYSRVHAICIGHSTEKMAIKYGMKTSVSQSATIESMAKCMEDLHAEKLQERDK